MNFNHDKFASKRDYARRLLCSVFSSLFDFIHFTSCRVDDP